MLQVDRYSASSVPGVAIILVFSTDNNICTSMSVVNESNFSDIHSYITDLQNTKLSNIIYIHSELNRTLLRS